MITPNTIYWITRLDSICVALAIIFVLCSISSIVWAIFFVLSYTDCIDDDSIARCKNLYLKKFIFIPIAALATLFIGIFVPSTREACAMYVIPKIVNNENTQALSKEAIDLAHAWIEELKPKHEEEKNSSESKK